MQCYCNNIVLFVIFYYSVVQQCTVYQASSKQMTQTIYETIYKICGGNGICSEYAIIIILLSQHFNTHCFHHYDFIGLKVPHLHTLCILQPFNVVKDILRMIALVNIILY